MPAWVHGRADVAGLLLGCRKPFVQLWVVWSCIFIPVFVWTCSPCSTTDKHPSSYLLCSLNCGPQCPHSDLRNLFRTTGKVISVLPIALLSSHPANQGTACLLYLPFRLQFNQIRAILMTKMRIYAHCKHVSFTSRVGKDTNFLTPPKNRGAGCQWQQ